MTVFHVHLISDSTGGTLSSVVKACLSQFEGIETEQHFWPLVRTQRQLQGVLESVAHNPGLVLYTLVDDALIQTLEKYCQASGLPALSVLHPVLQMMSGAFHKQSLAKPGMQHKLNAEYFARMDAVDYALHHDDGQKNDQDLSEADVVMVGVSRTSKTPTCVYLAIRGIRAANVPLVPGMPPPPQLLAARQPLIVGLWVSPDRLVQVRRNRLTSMGENRDSTYVELDAVRAEIAATRQLFEKQDWPMIDVSRRSIEETAAAVMNLLSERKEAMA